MSLYKVSILIPVYKASPFIEKCAESVFSQTFESIEYIFVDDCSPDDSIDKLKQILLHFPNRSTSVTILKNDKNSGISFSRQRAFDAATAAYFLAMDSDDWIEPNMIEVLYNKALEENADIVYSPYFEDKADGTQRIVKPVFSTDKIQLIYDAFIGFSAYWNKLISRKILIDNNISTLENVSFSDDLVVLTKVIYFSNRFELVNKPLYHYVQYNTESITKKISSPRHIKDRFEVMTEVENFLKNRPDYDKYFNALLIFKALRKIKVIRTTNGDKQYLGLFPEIDNYIKSMNLSLKSKVILSLAGNNKPISLKFYLWLLKAAGKLTGREFY